MLEDYYKPFEDFDNVGVKKTFTRVFKDTFLFFNDKFKSQNSQCKENYVKSNEQFPP